MSNVFRHAPPPERPQSLALSLSRRHQGRANIGPTSVRLAFAYLPAPRGRAGAIILARLKVGAAGLASCARPPARLALDADQFDWPTGKHHDNCATICGTPTRRTRPARVCSDSARGRKRLIRAGRARITRRRKTSLAWPHDSFSSCKILSGGCLKQLGRLFACCVAQAGTTWARAWKQSAPAQRRKWPSDTSSAGPFVLYGPFLFVSNFVHQLPLRPSVWLSHSHSLSLSLRPIARPCGVSKHTGARSRRNEGRRKFNCILQTRKHGARFSGWLIQVPLSRQRWPRPRRAAHLADSICGRVASRSWRGF